jgi:molecular chaperone DnaK
MTVVGIDLGTTFSSVACCQNGKVEVLPNRSGDLLTPSAIAIRDECVIVGKQAQDLQIIDPSTTALSIKREIGTNHRQRINDKDYSPEEITALILSQLKQDAEKYLGGSVTQAVITVPAYFSEIKRRSTKNAAFLAGLKVLRILSEPTAACLSHFHYLKKDEKVLAIDLGGGTFDVSVLDVSEDVFEVLATAGNTRLGGEDWDDCIVQWILKEARVNPNELQRKDMARLKQEAERVKKELSQTSEAQVYVPQILGRELNIVLTREKFEEITVDLLKTIEPTINRAIEDSKLQLNKITKVLLIGGAIRVPKVTNTIKELFKGPKLPQFNHLPDESVASGAAILGAILEGTFSGPVLADVVPLSLGVETADHTIKKIINRNTIVPAQGTDIFTTVIAPNSPRYGGSGFTVDISIYQGEEIEAHNPNNIYLGNVFLDIFYPSSSKIRVNFDIDVDGILTVKAQDQQTGKSVRKVIRSDILFPNDNEGKARVEKLVTRTNEKEREREEISKRFSQYLATSETILKEYGTRLDAEQIARLETKTNNLRNASNVVSQLEQLTDLENELKLYHWGSPPEKLVLDNLKSGTLKSRVNLGESLKNLIIRSGNLQENDFCYIRDYLTDLQELDIFGIDNKSLPDNAFDNTNGAFCNLHRLMFPKKLKTVGKDTFADLQASFYYPRNWKRLPDNFPKQSLPYDPRCSQAPNVQVPQNMVVKEGTQTEFVISLTNIVANNSDIVWYRKNEPKPLAQGKSLVLDNIGLSKSSYCVKITAPAGSEWISPVFSLTVEWDAGRDVLVVDHFTNGMLEGKVNEMWEGRDLSKLKVLKLSKGILGDKDFLFIRSYLTGLQELDIIGINNESLPDKAFNNTDGAFCNLRRLILPEKLRTVGKGTFINLQASLYYPQNWKRLPDNFPKQSLPYDPQCLQVPNIQISQNRAILLWLRNILKYH